MAGALFSFENFADSATLSSTTGIVASLPLSNLKDRRIALKARTTNILSGFNINADLLSPKKVRILGLIGANVTKSVDAGINVVVTASNTGFGVAPLILDESFFVNDRFPYGINPSLFAIINSGQGVTARYWELTYFWNTVGFNYYEAGRLWVGDGILLPDGVENDWSQTIKDPSTISRSRGQQVYADVKQRYRKLNFSLGSLSKKIVFGDPDVSPMPLHFQQMFLTAGVTGEVLVIPRCGNNSVDENQFINRTAAYGVFSEEHTVRKEPGDNYSVNLSIEECL